MIVGRKARLLLLVLIPVAYVLIGWIAMWIQIALYLYVVFFVRCDDPRCELCYPPQTIAPPPSTLMYQQHEQPKPKQDSLTRYIQERAKKLVP